MSKGAGGGGRGSKGGKGGGAGGGVTQGSLDAAGIEGNAASINKAWEQQFGQPIKSVGEIHSLVGLGKGDLGAHGNVSVSTAFGRLEVTARGNGIQVGRTFKNGSVSHDHLFIASHMQGKGLGTKMLKTSVKQYQRLGVKSISLHAAEKGRYVWPSMGFRVSKATLGKYVSGYKDFRKANGLPPPGKIHSVQQIARSPLGKQYLLSSHAPSMEHMTIRTARLAKELAKR